MKLTFNIKIYHGTNHENVKSIIKNGFDINTLSCATQDKNFAKGYGDTLICFKYPFEVYFSIKNFLTDLEYFKRFLSDYFNKSLFTGVAGYKPKKIDVEYHKFYTIEELRQILYCFSDELDVSTDRITPPSLVSLVINKILG